MLGAGALVCKYGDQIDWWHCQSSAEPIWPLMFIMVSQVWHHLRWGYLISCPPSKIQDSNSVTQSSPYDTWGSRLRGNPILIYEGFTGSRDTRSSSTSISAEDIQDKTMVNFANKVSSNDSTVYRICGYNLSNSDRSTQTRV